MAPNTNSLYCVEVPLRNCSLTHYFTLVCCVDGCRWLD